MKRSTSQVLALLQRFESRNVTFVDPDGTWPIVWVRAKGCSVWDATGKRYLDLTAAFGVAAAGHANSRVVRAGQAQMATLLHAMGDVHPHPLKGLLAAELSGLTFERWGVPTRSRKQGATEPNRPPHGKVIFCNSGFEAVEAALKTALLATRKPGIVAFEGGYHGLGYGALNATHRAHFRLPFEQQLARFGRFLPFPRAREDLEGLERSLGRLLRRQPIGAVLVEPIQARGGINVPPAGFLPLLRRLCDAHGVLLVLDEIYTGFGRTGRWFACEHSGAVPDLICLGKALTGGFPLSACVGRSEVMDAAWPESTGEAIHTSTFLGHPVGCAMALAQIRELKTKRLPERAAVLGARLRTILAAMPTPRGLRLRARGVGLLAGLELRHRDGRPATEEVLRLMKGMLQRGYLVLPEGEFSQVLSFTPPLTIGERQLDAALSVLKSLLELS